MTQVMPDSSKLHLGVRRCSFVFSSFPSSHRFWLALYGCGFLFPNTPLLLYFSLALATTNANDIGEGLTLVSQHCFRILILLFFLFFSFLLFFIDRLVHDIHQQAFKQASVHLCKSWLVPFLPSSFFSMFFFSLLYTVLTWSSRTLYQIVTGWLVGWASHG